MKGTGNSGKGRFWLTLALVMTLIVIAVTISTTIGAVNVSASDIGKILVNKMSGKDIFQIAWEGKTENIIWNIRFPRVLMAFIVGAGLSLCGVLMQALTKNPLADPYVLGISSGASAGAVGVIILGWFSFLGGYSVIFGFCFLCFLIFPLSPCSFHPFSTVCTDLFHIYVEKAEIYSVSTVYLINFPPFLPWKCAL